MYLKNKISLIIPVYNVKNYLETSLNSAINQTLKEIEIICVNDGSTDGSDKILEKYAKKDSRIKIITQSNQGLSAARNAGLKKATGEFVSFLDSDDTLELNRLKKMYKNAKNRSLLVIADYNKIFTNGEIITYSSNLGTDPIKNLLNGYIRVPACAKLYDTNMLLQNNFKFAKNLYHEDDLSTLEILFYAKNKISILNEPIYNYMMRDGSISKIFTLKHAKDLVTISDKKRECLAKNGVLEIYKNYLFKHTLALLYYYLNISKANDDAKDILIAIFSEFKTRDYFNKALFLWLKKEFSYVYIAFVFLLLRWCKDIENFDSSSFFCEFIDRKDLEKFSQYALKFNFLHEILVDFLVKNNIKEVAIYGVGEIYAKLKPLLIKNNIKIIHLIDKKAKLSNFKVDNMQVLQYKDILANSDNLNVIITSVNTKILRSKLLGFCKINNKTHNIIDIVSIFKEGKNG